MNNIRNMSNSFVNKQKYDYIKDVAKKYKEKSDKLKEECGELKEKLSELYEDFESSLENMENMKREYDDGNCDVKNIVKKHKKEIREMNEYYKDKINKMERELIIKDSSIQRLEDSKKDLKERYQELKEDYRESQRWNRTSRKE